MKLTKTLACHMAVYSLLAGAFASCSSDPNPVSYINLNEGETAYVSIDLSVAATRTDADQYATDDETKISKVSLYIFDAKDNLESIKKDIEITENKISKIETTSGMKTIYAVAAGSISGVTEGKTTLSDFENTQLSSKLKDLKTEDGFLMIGKSNKQKVYISSSKETMPSSNTFSITLTRLAAKAQVVLGTDFYSSAESLGFTASATNFAVRQTADKMQLTPNSTENIFNFSSNAKSTYDDYTYKPSEEFTECKDGNYNYMAENIVTSPVTGNTTFACIQISLTPKKLYTYNNQTLSSTDNSSSNNSNDFYVVGLVDEETGFYDYVVDGDTHVICFSSIDDAKNYCNALNGNQISGTTVSESSEPLSKPASTRADSESSQFKVLTFTNSQVYYRVNIKKTDDSGNKYRIDRNTFYKITLNTINTLGVSDEDYLRPTNPATDLELSQSSWLDATFEVKAWDFVGQDVDL